MVLSPMLDVFERVAGLAYDPTSAQGDVNTNSIIFVDDESIKSEGYVMSVTNERIEIKASSNSGFFYAMQSIRQLLPVEIGSLERVRNVDWLVPSVELKDYPRMAYRGFMLDVSRYFMPKEDLLNIIDVISMLKINKLHLHLVDDNGWRIEIKKYPRLTEVGAWHAKRSEDYPARLGPMPNEEKPVGGFYTQDDIREIILYAQQRAIEVIPEIEMPAHTISSLSAYPEFACNSEGKYIGVTPGFVGHNGYTPVYCAGKEEVFSFLEDVLVEVMDLFPSKYIHIGGDEATTKYWEKCPDCKRRMRKEGIVKSHDLQGYFMNRINKIIQANGHTMIGWDELTLSEIPENTVIIGWRGKGECAYDAGKRGHNYVIALDNVYYLNHVQGPQWFEPLAYSGNITFKDIYDYEPLALAETEEVKSLNLGVQACLWTEFISSLDQAQHQLFPRIMAIAETAWSPEGQKDWGSFIKRVDNLLLYFDVAGINYARSMFNIDHVVTPCNGAVEVELSSIRPDVELRYTVDGSAPKATSTMYVEKIVIAESTVVKAATFASGEMMGDILEIPISFNKATGAVITGSDAKLELITNGVRAIERSIDHEWFSAYNKDVSFVIDLGAVESVKLISLGVLVDRNMGVGYPESVNFLLSTDGVEYVEAGQVNLSPEECFEYAVSTKDLIVDNLACEARYVKVEVVNPGIIPAGNPRVGQKSKVNIDEIIIL